jgi:acetyl-CoA carboxylase carboxyltransferase component
MPPRLRSLFDQIGVIVALAGVFGGGWIAVTGTYRPPMWVNPAAAAAVMGVASVLEAVARARRPRPAPARHRRPSS